MSAVNLIAVFAENQLGQMGRIRPRRFRFFKARSCASRGVY